jgi:hypothetical protein
MQPANLGRAALRAYIKLGLPTKLSKHAEDTAWRAIWIAAVVLLLGIVSALYSVLDAAGYISHTRETLISADPSWLVGESRICYSVPLEPEYVSRHKAWDVTHRVGWKCDRREDSFECYALD